MIMLKDGFSTEGETKWWKDNFRYGIYGGGSTDGLIPIIFKHHIYHNYLHVLKEYDRIILTRPDMYFVRHIQYCLMIMFGFQMEKIMVDI